MSAGRRLAALAVLAGCVLSNAARAESHRGAVGAYFAGGGEVSSIVGASSTSEGGGPSAELGASVAIDADGNELIGFVRGSLVGASAGLSLGVGYRGYFGPDAWKTFFDLGLTGELAPGFGVGPRIALGVQYDFHPLLGAFAVADARLLVGERLRVAGSLLIGLQLRSYWFG
jgi:hypothetical protein